MSDDVKKIYEYVKAQEDRYYEFASNALDKDNVFANQIHSAEATAFQRVRYFIETLEERK